MFERKAVNGFPGLLRFVEPVWSGITAYRGLISASAFPVDSNGISHNATQRPMMVRSPVIRSALTLKDLRSTAAKAR